MPKNKGQGRATSRYREGHFYNILFTPRDKQTNTQSLLLSEVGSVNGEQGCHEKIQAPHTPCARGSLICFKSRESEDERKFGVVRTIRAEGRTMAQELGRGGGRASISNWSEVITLLMLGSPIFSSLEGRGACIIQSRSGVAKCSREGTESSS